MSGRDAEQVFIVARDPQPDTKLPFLLKLPWEGGLALKAREVWPTTSRVYCHPFEEDWPEDPEIVEQVPVLFCRRRGAVIDLVLDRPRRARSQFVFTEVKGRPAIFWQTQKTARRANLGGRVPRRRALTSGFTISVDSRERYGYRFSGRDVLTERAALPAGDYAVRDEDGVIVAVVEGTSLENLATTPVGRGPGLPDPAPGELHHSAVVVEGRYPALLSSPYVPGAWLEEWPDCKVRYPEVQVVFADSRRFAEEGTYRFLAAAIADAPDQTPA